MKARILIAGGILAAGAVLFAPQIMAALPDIGPAGPIAEDIMDARADAMDRARSGIDWLAGAARAQLDGMRAPSGFPPA